MAIGSSVPAMVCSVLRSLMSCIYLLFWRNSLALWNPATGGFRQIPRTITSGFPPLDTNGFGFSAIASDYKIVRTSSGKELISGVEVYSLNTGSWKEIEFACLENLCLKIGGFGANGYIFWNAIKQVDEEFDLIVSFDIAMEVFSLIPYPDLLQNSSSEFTVYEEKLCILSLSRIGDFPNYSYSQIDLWVLEEGIGSSM